MLMHVYEYMHEMIMHVYENMHEVIMHVYDYAWCVICLWCMMHDASDEMQCMLGNKWPRESTNGMVLPLKQV